MYNALIMNTPYLNFDLLVEQTEESPFSAKKGTFSQLIESPKGNAIAPFVSTITQDELREFWQLMGEPYAGNADLQAEQTQAARALGSRLFQSVFAGDLGDRLHSSLQVAYQERAQLRIRLRLCNVPLAANLPWAYLCDPTSNEFVTASIHSPLVRSLDLMHQIRPIKVEPPLRMLVVIPNATNHAPINVEGEWFNLVDTLDYLARAGKMVIERLREPTLVGLHRQLRQKEYHILHFVGHGTYEPHAEDGLLLFQDERRVGRFVTGQHLGTLLHDHYSLRLALFDIRDGARGASRHPFLCVAEHFILRGMPTAVALQTELSPMLMATFVNQFYADVANLQPVDVAMTNARQALQTASDGMAWGSPVLFTRLTDGYIFDDGTWRAKVDADLLDAQPIPISESLRIRYMP